MKKQYSVLTHEANFTPPDLGSLLPVDEFDTAEEAIACLKRVIDKQLLGFLREGKTAKEAYDQFSLYGEIPIIRGEPRIYIQPYEYAKQRSVIIAGNMEISKKFSKRSD
jgi:hypothetical protein